MLMVSPGVESCGKPNRKVFTTVSHKLSLDVCEQIERRMNCIPRNSQSVKKVLPTKMNKAHLEDCPELWDIKC